ncbi:nucleoside recognition domain-containing protein [Paenibacillus tianjinensis]|uniref:Nucleoside recognition protein n=1 Tax=Paenibacillus tianjinensis TaxID=2810347 RepID=A0ABX7LJN8_9BACL|nr:nucleoside recognition domain-containing protein [Paenibacillus tianjinensis]QSF47219.1 nucleoside recognition protein [Paenibacillus tianjinensis]
MNNVKIRRFTSASAPFVAGAAAILLAVAIVSAPESSFAASLQGLKLWWTLIFPALLPFLILSEMLTASGFVHGFGVLLEPLMTKVFRLPGAGGWTLALGMTAGFPAGAGGVQQLHKQGSISDKEAVRLAALAHFASPVTLVIVVGVAFLHSPAAGYTLLAIHWLSGLAAGFTAALFAGRRNSVAQDITRVIKPLPKRVHQAVLEARERDGRSFGKLLGETVASAVQNLMVVGGYMIMFSVVINIAATLFPQLPTALAASVLEIHLGANALTTQAAAPFVFSSTGVTGMALLSAALGWSGICGQLQSLTALKQAKARFIPYAAVRLLHSLYAFAFTFLLWKPLLNVRAVVLPAISSTEAAVTPETLSPFTVWNVIPQLLSLQSILLLLLLVLSALVYAVTSSGRPAG